MLGQDWCTWLQDPTAATAAAATAAAATATARGGSEQPRQQGAGQAQREALL